MRRGSVFFPNRIELLRILGREVDLIVGVQERRGGGRGNVRFGDYAGILLVHADDVEVVTWNS